MIFVCLGSREYQFDRLLKEVDKLIDDNVIKEEVFAQIGQSSYEPMNYNYERFLSSEDFIKKQKESSLIISHAGSGALMGALKLNKKVIAVPRREKFGEHTDDHQLQIAQALEQQGYLKSVLDINELGETIKNMSEVNTFKEYSKESKVIDIILKYLNGI